MEGFKCLKTKEYCCYVCGDYVKKASRRPFKSANHQKYYKLCYPNVTNNVRYSYQATSICNSCRFNICTVGEAKENRVKTNTKLKFSEPARWVHPKADHSNCFLCNTDFGGNLDRANLNILSNYNNELSLKLPILRDSDLENESDYYSELENYSDIEYESDEDYQVDDEVKQGEMVVDKQLSVKQENVDNFVKILKLDINRSKLFASMLKRLLKKHRNIKIDFKITNYDKRTKELKPFFTLTRDGKTVYMSDLQGYMNYLGFRYNRDNWRLFIDSSSSSFKACLIHNMNHVLERKLPTIPLLYSTTLSESYDDLKKVLELLNYNNENWYISADFKILNQLVGLSASYCSFCCILCLWHSRRRDEHYVKTNFTKRNIKKGEAVDPKNQESRINPSLVNLEKILLPPLHIKLGVFGQFIKSLVPTTGKAGNPNAITFLKNFFPKKTSEKILNGVFTGPEIRRLIKKREEFANVLNKLEKNCWYSFIDVVENFFGNYRHPQAERKVQKMLNYYQKQNVLMSPKVHYLHQHLDQFKESCGGYSDEQGERFHQEIKVFELRYQQNILGMIVDYIWNKFLDVEYEGRKTRDQSFFIKQ